MPAKKTGRKVRATPRLNKKTQVRTASSAKSKKQTEGKASLKKSKRFPIFVEPMKAKLVNSVPNGEWTYEIKFDGFRALAFKIGNTVKLISRNNKLFNEKFPEVASAIAKLNADTAILDGEICALDEKGITSFQNLQGRDLGKNLSPLFFYVFDLLNHNGKNLCDEILLNRRAILKKLLSKSPSAIRFSESLNDDVKTLMKRAAKLGFEGLIGKLTNSIYEPGRRSGAWIKLKLNKEQEFVIGGYTEPQGERSHFGAILIGYYMGKKLHFAGKVGTGFNRILLSKLFSKFKKIGSKNCPFINVPEAELGRWGSSLTVAEMKRCHWIKPEMVCQIKFTEWTQDGKLRHPVFLGLREDKEAFQVIREEAE